MNKDLIRQIAVILALVMTLVVNWLANYLPIGGKNTGQISNQFSIYFVPSGYVFSIWGLIYLGLLAFAIFQAMPAQRENRYLRRIGWWFVLSCVANTTWIFLWHHEKFVWTLGAMFVLLLSLIMVYLRLEVGLNTVSAKERWLMRVPFQIYLGWVSVATIANISTTLNYHKWGGWGISEQIWAVIMLIVATILAAAVSFMRRDIPYLLVFIWAFIGIGIKQQHAPSVYIAAYAATAIVAVFIVLVAFVLPAKTTRISNI